MHVMQYWWALICVSVIWAEVPTNPSVSQWKVPVYHRREKIDLTRVHYVPLSAPITTHKQTQQFVNTLEYNAQHELQDSADLGLTILDLNSVLDDEVAKRVEEGVDAAIEVIDQEAGETAQAELIEQHPVMMMNQGKYEMVPSLNPMLDGLLKQTQKVMKRRQMDPLYFTVHKRGIVRHNPGDAVLANGQLAPSATLDNVTAQTNSPLGGGIITGMAKLKRFGNVERRETQNETLIRSHFYFGPMKVDLVFETTLGLRMVNSTLSSLAGHALFSSSTEDTSLDLVEFVIDSPMEYEIRMKDSRNLRLRRLSQSAITRLFKRSGRMQKRLRVCVMRASLRPVAQFIKQTKKQTAHNNHKQINKKLMKLNEMKRT